MSGDIYRDIHGFPGAKVIGAVFGECRVPHTSTKYQGLSYSIKAKTSHSPTKVLGAIVRKIRNGGRNELVAVQCG